MGFLSNALGSVLRFVFPRQFREELVEEIEKEVRLFRRKIAKTGMSHEGNRNLFAFTFEDNRNDRERFLIDKVNEFFESSVPNDAFGYEDFIMVANPPFIYPQFEVGKE